MYTYNPVLWSGEYAQGVHQAVIEANRTSSRSLLRVEDKIKNERLLTSISGGVAWQKYKEKIRETDIDALAAANDLKFGDRKVLPKKIMAFDNWLMDQLRSTRFGASMAEGANNIGSTEFEQAATGYLIPRMGKSYEALLYQSITQETKDAIAASATIPASQKAWAAARPAGEFDGIITKMITATAAEAGGGVVKSVVSVGALTTSNAIEEYANIYKAIDQAELEEGNVVIFAPLSDFQIIQLANLNQEFRDKFVVTGSGATAVVTFLNIPVEFVPTGGPRFAGKAGVEGDFVHATDLTSDADTTFVIGKVNNYSDDLFFKMVATADTTVLSSSKKVLCL